MSEEKRYKELLTKRSSKKVQITKFKNYLNSASNQTALTNIQLTELTLKLAKFEVLSLRFDELQNKLEVLVPANIETEVEERENIESDIITNIATAKTLLESFSMQQEREKGAILVMTVHVVKEDAAIVMMIHVIRKRNMT